MGRFSRAELEQAFEHYSAVVDTCSETGDWRPFADLFTEAGLDYVSCSPFRVPVARLEAARASAEGPSDSA